MALGPERVVARVQFVLPFLAQIWLFLTPVLYPASVIPERWRVLYAMNPMVTVTEFFRWAMLGGVVCRNRVLLGRSGRRFARSPVGRARAGGERPNTIPAVKVQYSSDRFVTDVRTADTVKIAQNTERNAYDIAPSAKARFWRLLADAPTDGGHWGVVELRFSQYPAWRRPLRRTGARG